MSRNPIAGQIAIPWGERPTRSAMSKRSQALILARMLEGEAGMALVLIASRPRLLPWRDPMTEPDDAVWRTLLDFRARHGKDCREQLSIAWMNGSDASEPRGSELRHIQNRFRPGCATSPKPNLTPIRCDCGSRPPCVPCARHCYQARSSLL